MERMHYHLHAIDLIIFITVKSIKIAFSVPFQLVGTISMATAVTGTAALSPTEAGWGFSYLCLVKENARFCSGSLWCSDTANTNFSSYWSGDSMSGYCTVCPIDSGILHRGNSEPICHCSCNQGYQQESNDLFICKQFGQFYCPECQNSFLTGNVFTQIIFIYVMVSIT